MAGIIGLLKSSFGKPEIAVGIGGEREMPFERKILNLDRSRRFLFRASEEGRVLTIALQAKNSVGGWGDVFEANEVQGEEGGQQRMIRLEAATRDCFTSDSLQIYSHSGKRRDGGMVGGVGGPFGEPSGEADKMISTGHFPIEDLPEKIMTDATVAAFLEQVRAGDFSTPRLIDVESGDDSLIVPLFRGLLT